MKKNPILHLLAWQMCGILYIYAAATKIGMSILLPVLLLKLRICAFTLLSFMWYKSLRILNVFMVPESSKTSQLAYKATKSSLSSQAEQKKKFEWLCKSCVPYESV